MTRLMVSDESPRARHQRNSATAPYLWAVAVLSVGPAVLWWGHTAVLATCAALFVALYVGAYVALIRRWL